MKKYYLAPAMMLLALLLAGGPTQTAAQDAKTPFVLTSPRAGQVLMAGQVIEVTFDVNLDKAFMENEWAEMEFFLETAEGVHVRLTPQMRMSAKSFTWTVPNINTRTAKLAVQAGIEGAGDQYRFAQSGTFRIIGSKSASTISLGALSEAVAGKDLNITWVSDLPKGTTYDVLISYDRGAHFTKFGSTTGTEFNLPIEANFAGSITVQISYTRADGTKITSLQTRGATVVVGDDEK